MEPRHATQAKRFRLLKKPASFHPMMRALWTAVLCLAMFGCQHGASQTGPEQTGPTQEPITPEGAKAFVARVNAELKPLRAAWERAEWVKATYITEDTEILAAAAHAEVMAYMGETVAEAQRFEGLDLDPETARALLLLKVSSTLPAPKDPALRTELAGIAAELGSMYGRGKVCEAGVCQSLGELSQTLAHSHDDHALLKAWTGWREVSKPMRVKYERFVQLANQGASELGFHDLGELWRAGYDMSPEAFFAENDRLWADVKPLYEALHCYVRRKLGETYGADKVPADQPIPAHLLGNMWAQEWGNIYNLVAPYPKTPRVDLTQNLVQKGLKPLQMVKMAEGFFKSMGLSPLPQTFWERSMFTKPRDRDVVCHASAWDVDYNNDLRIKMCIEVNAEEFTTIHHELGHNYYYSYYYKLPILFQQGANDGFHEGIGDTIALSVTPAYLKTIGLLDTLPPDNEEALINQQMQDALDKIAFLPFGKMIDQWRWEVFSGKIKPADYNKAWWALREKLQGIRAPTERSEADFDPGAKYHVAGNVPYTRYFLARILQFQFHRALCKAAGHQGPLHTCSIYRSKAAGERLKAMLRLGASRPWPDALEAISGERQMDASALVEYFAPLSNWLNTQNAGHKCGW